MDNSNLNSKKQSISFYEETKSSTEDHQDSTLSHRLDLNNQSNESEFEKNDTCKKSSTGKLKIINKASVIFVSKKILNTKSIILLILNTYIETPMTKKAKQSEKTQPKTILIPKLYQ